MPTATIYFLEEEDEKIEKYSKKWKLPKYEVVKKIIRLFKEKNEHS